jgi:hypothetical protein
MKRARITSAVSAAVSATLLGPLLFPVVGLGTARAETTESGAPSVFVQGYRGLLVGGLVGVSAGYLFARDDGWDSGEDWRPLVYGVGFGALAGGALGVTLGAVDMSRGAPGRGAIVLRDTVYGAGFGATAGAIAGGLAAVSTKEPEHILLGGAIGALAGAALGIGIGIVEGYRLPEARSAAADRRWTLTITPARQADHSLAWLPAAVGRY